MFIHPQESKVVRCEQMKTVEGQYQALPSFGHERYIVGPPVTVVLSIVAIVGCKIVNLRNGRWQPNINAKQVEAAFDKQDTTGLFPGFSHNNNK